MAFASGALVELHGLPDVLEASSLLGTSDGSAPSAYRPNGKRGKIVDITGVGHIVETFDAVFLSVPAENLKAYSPDAPREGGFHLAWPATGAEPEAEFAVRAVSQLADEGYCVIQMSMSEQKMEEAMDEAAKMKSTRMRSEFEGAYLGRDHSCKTAWLEQLAENKKDVSGGLDYCDLQMSAFTKFLLPLAPCALEFVPYSRTNGMVRMPFQNSSEQNSSFAVDLNDEDIEDGLVDSHIQFLRRRQVGLIYTVSTGGGELTLIHKDQDKENIVLELARGRLVAFLTSRMTYVYHPFDRADLALQSWVLQEPDGLKFISLQGDQASKDEAWGLTIGPKTPQGMQTNVFGIGIQLPGGAQGAESRYWAELAIGTDAQVYVPLARFEMDLYARPADDWFPGTTYAVHGGFVTEDIYALDAELFGIAEEEAYIMGPTHRQLLEKGYEALYKTGLRQGSDLRGRKVGIFVGHSGDDWSFTQQFTCGYEDRFRRGHAGRHWSSIAGRLAFVLGLKGPQVLIDTACSSALVAYGVGHTMMRSVDSSSMQTKSSVDNALNESLMCGINLMPGPGNYINLSGPHMLSVIGRCFTFDHSADGFARGEGDGAFLVRNEAIMSRDSLATVIGACLNQDGRSASMTAPNGPAQQECIRGSMLEAQRTANEVTCAECHGTGTALGDPIEVGALRGVMENRVIPLIQTSAKAHLGHLEAGAGTAGIIKCMLMCAACSGTPNCHLTELNPHLDVNGYPTFFATELSDYGANAGYSGVSSFGFGGANSRADVFASAKLGPHATMKRMDWEKVDYITVRCPVDLGPMHFMDGKCIPRAASKDYKHDVYHADGIRHEFDSYDYNSSLYEGEYQLAPADPVGEDAPKDPIYIVGSWDQFHESHQMVEGDDDDTWTFILMLGETRHERFQLRVDDNKYMALYPCVKNASAFTRCMGPDNQGEGCYWQVDGRDEEMPAGTVYRVTLRWGSPPIVRWEVVDAPRPVWALRLRHLYSVDGSWTGGVYEPLKDISTDEKPNTWEGQLRIGMTGMEWFRLVRDSDPEQVIYPLTETVCYEELLVCGPNGLCNNRSFRLKGKIGEMVTLRLQVVDAHVSVTVLSPSMGTIKMDSKEGVQRHTYYVSGSFNGWSYFPMALDEGSSSTFRYPAQIGYGCKEFFYILMDREPALAFFPEAEGAYPGDSIVLGPEPVAETACFCVYSLKAGATFDITFDRKAMDRRKVVQVHWNDRVDADSMKLAYQNFAAMRGVMGLTDKLAALPKLA